MASANGGQPAVPSAVLARLRAHRNRGLEHDAHWTRLVLAVHLMEPWPPGDHRHLGPAWPRAAGDGRLVVVVSAGVPAAHTTGHHGRAVVPGFQRTLRSTSHHAGTRPEVEVPRVRRCEALGHVPHLLSGGGSRPRPGSVPGPSGGAVP